MTRTARLAAVAVLTVVGAAVIGCTYRSQESMKRQAACEGHVEQQSVPVENYERSQADIARAMDESIGGVSEELGREDRWVCRYDPTVNDDWHVLFAHVLATRSCGASRSANLASPRYSPA